METRKNTPHQRPPQRRVQRPLSPQERTRLRKERMRKRRQQQIRSLILLVCFFILIVVILVIALTKKDPKPASNAPTASESSLPPVDIEPENSSEPESEPEPQKKELHFVLPDASVTAGTDAARIDFSHGPSVDNQVHHIVKQQQEGIFSKYDAYAVDLETPASEKVLYMTFDCGYEYEGRTEACLDVLKEKNVPAAFYLVGDFAEMEPELTQRMIDEGHVVGNHTMGHEDLTTLDDAAAMKAVQDFDIYMKENFNYNATTFRFSSGTFSERTLAMVHSFGYKTYFWSIAYADWERDLSIGTDAAMDLLKSQLHPGAILLLHCVSADEPAVLEAFIDYAHAEGYTFRLIEE